VLGAQAPSRPDGLYAEMRTSKGLILARLEFELTPLTVSNFVGLAEGTIENAAFDRGWPFYDGSIYHRVIPGHVIQTGVPQSDRAKNPGYQFPNEIHARLSHNHAGALNIANGGPNTNAAQFCITLGDRSYLDGDYTVFGEVVQGLDIVMRIVQGDVLESVRIVRVGAKAQAFHPTTESFRAMLREADDRVKMHAEKKSAAEREWIAQHYPKALDAGNGVMTQVLAEGHEGAAARVHYRGIELRYVGNVVGRDGPAIEAISFASGDGGVPGPFDPPHTFEPKKINPGLDGVLAKMRAGERTIVIVPAAQAYGRAGFYPPEIPGKRRFVISPYTLLVYDVEAEGN